MALATPSPPRPINHSPPRPGLGFKPRSFEDQVRLAYHTPPPGKYSPSYPGHKSKAVLGKISEARIPSALDFGQLEKSLVPGPGSYETPDLKDIALPEGGRLSRKPPQEKFKLDEYPSPAPGTYGVPADPTVPRKLYGAFSKDPRITKFIADEVKRSAEVPAPGSHDVMDSMESMRPFCPEGGRYLKQVGRSASYFEAAAKLAQSKPGPDAYNLPGALRPNKAAGKLVWKYQSETLEQTKKIITKVVGTGHENPAPGHYNIPDPAPLAQSPAIRGRTLSHGMPHPYAYNCSPDLSGKYDALAPVRSKNAGDEIYGRDFTKASPGKDRASKAKESADEIASNQMPYTMAERNIQQPGETAQWRSGGFQTLQKSKSSPVIRKPEHPAMVETLKRYPMMSKFHGRKDKSFVPYAHRKPEIVRTSSKSEEFITLQRKKWEVGELAKEIGDATAATMEPLDEEHLREQAMHGIVDKAMFKMRMEGLSRDQQELVLAELPGVIGHSNEGHGGIHHHVEGEDSDEDMEGQKAEGRQPSHVATDLQEMFADPRLARASVSLSHLAHHDPQHHHLPGSRGESKMAPPSGGPSRSPSRGGSKGDGAAKRKDDTSEAL